MAPVVRRVVALVVRSHMKTSSLPFVSFGSFGTRLDAGEVKLIRCGVTFLEVTPPG